VSTLAVPADLDAIAAGLKKKRDLDSADSLLTSVSS
jgi:hypothetical protein